MVVLRSLYDLYSQPGTRATFRGIAEKFDLPPYSERSSA